MEKVAVENKIQLQQAIPLLALNGSDSWITLTGQTLSQTTLLLADIVVWVWIMKVKKFNLVSFLGELTPWGECGDL